MTERVPPGAAGPTSGPGAEPAPLVSLPPVVRAGAGSTSSVPLTVTNTASEPRELVVLGVGIDQGWLPGPVRTRVLASGESEQVALTLTPASGTLPAEYPLAVTVQSVDPATGRASAAPTGLGETSVVVNPRAQLMLEATPEQTSLVRGRRLRVTLRNTGVAPATVELSGVATKGLLVRLRHREVTVPAGGQTRVRGRLVVTRPRRVGGRVSHSWTVNATSPEIVRQVRGTAQQRALFGNGLMKAVAVLAVVAVWAAAVLVLVQEVPERINKDEASQAAGDEGAGGGGGDDGGGGGAEGDGAAGSGKVTVTQAAANEPPAGLQVTGAVEAADPEGVVVTLDAISLADSEAQSAENFDEIRTVAHQPASGKTSPSSFLLRLPEQAKKKNKLNACDTRGECTATTTDDGTWSILDVEPTGYYLVTFTKPGLDTQSFVVDASTFDPTEPLEVEMVPGDGALRGTVRDAQGRPLGGATVTVSDGTSTITTSTASKGSDLGLWEVSGLATPASYTVQVSSFGLGTEARLVDLQPDEEESVDVRMRAGVALVSGLIEGKASDNETEELGGVSVTVTNSDGEVRSVTTTTTGNQRGRFSLSGVPVPGDYTVTLSAPGYQTQTQRLSLDDGQGAARVDGNLASATGGVGGVVTFAADGKPVEGAGLTLSNGVNTYKTTSLSQSAATRRDQVGGFEFTGVKPGLYQLTTEYFQFRVSVLTVAVPAGSPERADPELRKLGGGVVPATSIIKGSALEAGTLNEIACTPAGSECLTATLTDSDGKKLSEVTFLPTDQYTLPDPVTKKGLPPGLYTVTVSASRYESARTRVQVGIDDVAVADTVELVKAPYLSGELTTVVGTPGEPTCIWAVRGTGTPGSCAAQTDTTCPDDEATFTDPTVTALCVKVVGTGDYRIELPRRGEYQVFVQPRDSEYLTPGPVRINAPAGGTFTHNVQLNRYGRLTLNTLEAGTGAGAALVASEGAEATVTPGAGVDTTRLSDENGRLLITGFRPGVIYAVTAAKNQGEADEIASDAFGIIVGLNQEPTRTVALLDRVDATVVRVTTRFTGDLTPVSGATVRIAAPVGYAGTNPFYGTGEATTEADGCAAIVRSLTVTPAAVGDCDATYGFGARGERAFVSRTASGVTVTAAGYEPLVLGTTELTSNLNGFMLDPLPVSFSGSIDTDPGDDVPTWGDATFEITSTTTSTSTITLTAAPGSEPTGPGVLTWRDTRLGADNDIRPGRYEVTASLPGYESDTASITCVDVGATCTFDGLRLEKLGSLTVRALTEDGDDADTDPDAVNNVVVTLLRNTTSLEQRTSANDGNVVTFPDLLPSEANYKVRVQAAGFRAAVYPLTGADSGLTCGGSPATAIAIASGAETDCSVSLARLGTFTGAVTGVLGDHPATTPTRLLAGATVTATPCTQTALTSATPPVRYCRAVDATRRLTTVTMADGSYRLTGTATVAGITEGYWLLTTNQPGWSQPPRAAGVPATGANAGLRGTLADVTTTGDIPQDLTMYVNRVDFTVRVNDQAGTRVNKATVRLMQGETEVQVGEVSCACATAQYDFDDALPGLYILEISGGGLIRTTTQVEIQAGVASQSFQAYVSRAANTVTARSVGDDQPDGLAGVTVFLVECDADGTNCGTSAATGTDDELLTDTTGSDGRFTFRTVPNGYYAVRFRKLGYSPENSAALRFDHTLGTVPAVTATQVSTKRLVNVTLDTSTATDDLTGAEVTLTKVEVDGNLNGDKTDTVAVRSASFGQVRFGCWDVSLELPDYHFGAITLPSDTTNAALGCTGNVVVPPTANSNPLSVTIAVVETELRVSLAATPLSGHTAPTTGAVTVTRTDADPDEVVFDDDSFPVGPVGTHPSLWVEPGTYTATADVTSGFSSTFWPSVTTAAVNVTNSPRARSVTLTEVTGSVDVSATGATADRPVTVTVAAGTGQTAAVPAAYADGVVVTAATATTFDLPSGPWTFTANFTDAEGVPVAGSTPDSADATIDELVEPDTVTLEPEYPPPPPPPPPPGP